MLASKTIKCIGKEWKGKKTKKYTTINRKSRGKIIETKMYIKIIIEEKKEETKNK